jgi:hypothetical protein
MAELIKYISTFSEDAVRMAIERVVVDKNKREVFVDILTTVKSVLPKTLARKKKMVKLFHQTDEHIFTQIIIPQIVEKLTNYDRAEMVGNPVVWKVSLDFIDGVDYRKMDMEELKGKHDKILHAEQTLICLDLVVKYHRGLVYYRAREVNAAAQGASTSGPAAGGEQSESRTGGAAAALSVKKMFPVEFGIGYATAMRYITFSATMKRYPRMFISELSYAQISKHQQRLLEYLGKHQELHDQLSQPLYVEAHDAVVDIVPADIAVPTKVYDVDPDYVYDDKPGDDEESEVEENGIWLDAIGEVLDNPIRDEDSELILLMDGLH